MNNVHQFVGILFSTFVILIAGGCRSDFVERPLEYVPKAPDYAYSGMWKIVANDSVGAGVDVFYVPSTWEYDWYTEYGDLICHYADPSRDDHRAHMAIEMDGVAEYMAEGNNFYSPYYRHISLDTWATLDEDTINCRFHKVAFDDVRRAFDHFLMFLNHGRPFILAGFSQGGKAVVELLKELRWDVRDRMVAAYVLGYKVTPGDVAYHQYIKAAQDSTDTGVVVCYNSVSDVRYVKPVVAAPNTMCINPVNWRTDATPAVLNDTITVTLDPEAKVLVVEGFDGSYLPNILDILNVGDYHGAEPWLYSECLRRNFHQRINAYKEKR